MTDESQFGVVSYFPFLSFFGFWSHSSKITLKINVIAKSEKLNERNERTNKQANKTNTSFGAYKLCWKTTPMITTHSGMAKQNAKLFRIITQMEGRKVRKKKK